MRHGRAGVGHDELDDVEGEGVLHEQGDGPGPHGVGGEGVAVELLAGHAAEQRAGDDRARVVRHLAEHDAGGVASYHDLPTEKGEEVGQRQCRELGDVSHRRGQPGLPGPRPPGRRPRPVRWPRPRRPGARR